MCTVTSIFLHFLHKTPVHRAAINGHLSCIKLLVEKGADLDTPNANGDTAVELAMKEGHANCVQYLHQETGNLLPPLHVVKIIDLVILIMTV